MEYVTKNGETFPVQEEIYATYSKQPRNGKAYLHIRKRRFYVMPKIKFVRRCDKTVALEKIDIKTYEITTPFTLKKETKSRSWLGNGMQNDDINCYQEWEEDVIAYDEKELNKFINEKLSLHK